MASSAGKNQNYFFCRSFVRSFRPDRVGDQIRRRAERGDGSIPYNDKKRLSAKRRQAQTNYTIYLHDFCIHTHSRNIPVEGLRFFSWCKSWTLRKSKKDTENNLPSATVPLQVVIGLCKRKETAALKIKAAASNRRVDWLLYDGFFSFAVAQQSKLTVYLLTV